MDKCENCGTTREADDVRWRPNADVDLCYECAVGLEYILPGGG